MPVGKPGTGERGAGSMKPYLPSAQGSAGGKRSHGAGADIRDQGHAGGQMRVGKEEADREVAPVTAPARLAGAAKRRSVQ